MIDKLPVEVIRKIYEYDSTSKIKFDKVLTQLTAHSSYSDVPNVSKNGINVCVIVNSAEPISDYAIEYISTMRVLMMMI